VQNFQEKKTVPIFATANHNISVVLKGLEEILKRPTRANCKSADYVGFESYSPQKAASNCSFFLTIYEKNTAFKT
jgi:translation initiation factor 2 gamma subunit (eIF-2gamma)